jgi:hypothetical protein
MYITQTTIHKEELNILKPTANKHVHLIFVSLYGELVENMITDLQLH